MTIYVFSDTHHHTERILRLLKRDPPDAVFHLGDNSADADIISRAFPSIPLYCVAGNCDPFSSAPEYLFLEFDGFKFFLCHGHRYYVKNTLVHIIEKALQLRADAALFGHTHTPVIRHDSHYGLLLINPGSAEYNGTLRYVTIQTCPVLSVRAETAAL